MDFNGKSIRCVLLASLVHLVKITYRTLISLCQPVPCLFSSPVSFSEFMGKGIYYIFVFLDVIIRLLITIYFTRQFRIYFNHCFKTMREHSLCLNLNIDRNYKKKKNVNSTKIFFFFIFRDEIKEKKRSYLKSQICLYLFPLFTCSKDKKLI